MGLYGIKWEHEKSKDYCSCKSTHDQVQPETRRGVSGSNGKAQRQNLLRSRGDLSRRINNLLSTTQTSKLWGCMLGRNRRERYSLRLDRGSPGEASFHQVKASNDSQTWNTSFCSCLSLHRSLQSKNLRKNYRSIKFKLDRGLAAPVWTLKKKIKNNPQATSHKLLSLKLQASRTGGGGGGWAQKTQAPGIF